MVNEQTFGKNLVMPLPSKTNAASSCRSANTYTETWFPLVQPGIRDPLGETGLFWHDFSHPCTFWNSFNVMLMTNHLLYIFSDFSCRGYSTPLCTRRKYRMEKVKFSRWVQKLLPTSHCPLAVFKTVLIQSKTTHVVPECRNGVICFVWTWSRYSLMHCSYGWGFVVILWGLFLQEHTLPFNIETYLNRWAGSVSISAYIWKTNFRSILSQIKSHFLQEIKVPVL